MSQDFQIAWPSDIPQMGVYLIRCLPTGQVYVGQSRRIRGRWRDHLKELRAGTGSPKLQKVWDQYGSASFVFEVVEVVDETALSDREQYYLDHFRAATDGLNTLPRVGTFEGYTPDQEAREKIGAATRKRLQDVGYREKLAAAIRAGKRASSYSPTEQHRRNIGQAQKGKPRGPMSEATKEAISLAHRGRAPVEAIRAKTGSHLSDVTKRKIGEANRGRVWTQEQRDRLVGRKLGAEHKKRMSEARKGVPWTPARRAAYERSK